MHTLDLQVGIFVPYPIGSASKSMCVGFTPIEDCQNLTHAIELSVGTPPSNELRALCKKKCPEKAAVAKRKVKIFLENGETVHAKHEVVKWGNPFFCAQAQCGQGQHEKKNVKTLRGEMAKPFFGTECPFAKSQEVKWRNPFFGVQTPRGQSRRKEGCKTPQGRVDRISIFGAPGTFSQELPQQWYRCTMINLRQ